MHNAAGFSVFVKFFSTHFFRSYTFAGIKLLLDNVVNVLPHSHFATCCWLLLQGGREQQKRANFSCINATVHDSHIMCEGARLRGKKYEKCFFNQFSLWLVVLAVGVDSLENEKC